MLELFLSYAHKKHIVDNSYCFHVTNDELYLWVGDSASRGQK